MSQFDRFLLARAEERLRRQPPVRTKRRTWDRRLIVKKDGVRRDPLAPAVVCLTCGGAGVWWQENPPSAGGQRPVICRDCPAFYKKEQR